MKKLFTVCLAAAVLAVPTSFASAQEMIHALAGTVDNVDQKDGTIAINTDDGSRGTFKAAAKLPAALDKSLRADVIPAAEFTSKSEHVIVYYIGDSEVRTAVAVKDLGHAALEKDTGTVVRFDKHAHLLTIKNDKGTELSFHIAPNTVTETSTGAVEGFKFDLDKGQSVRITATGANGDETALFIVPAV
jgi:hypothetical protein